MQVNPNLNQHYLEIWSLLNQSIDSVDLVNKNNIVASVQLNHQEVKQYFEEKDNYKVINLSSLVDEDRIYLGKIGFREEYLFRNKDRSITRNGLQPFDDLKYQDLDFQKVCLKEGYIYTVCPITGETLASNHSLPSSNSGYVFYRFSNQQVFYLICGIPGTGFPKVALYFPNFDLIINLHEKGNVIVYTIQPLVISHWKAYLVCNWKNVVQYLSNPKKKEIAAMLHHRSIAHYLLNLLSGINRLSTDLKEIDRFLCVEPNYYGCLSNIFSEVEEEKIENFQYSQQLFNYIISNNFFVLCLGDKFINNSFIDRLLMSSKKQCSSQFLSSVQEAKKVCFPLLLITIRLHTRTWVSQKEGIVNIIKCLKAQFPSLGIVFDGCSISDETKIIDPSLEKFIQAEKDMVSHIESDLSGLCIQTYNNIGRPIYEGIVWLDEMELCLSHGGSTFWKIYFIGNKPSVVHSNREMLSRTSSIEILRENGISPVFIHENEVTEIPVPGKHALDNNYDCKWETLYKKLLNLALQLTASRNN